MAMGPCGPCAPGATPFGGPGSGLWPSGSGFFESTLGVVNAAGGGGTTPSQGPAPVLLGTAGNFKILTKAGITNIAPSSVIGDMGVSPIGAAAITGFALVLDGGGQFATSAQVTGLVYAADYAAPTPAMLTAAVSAMEAAYTDAAGRPAQFINLNAGIIGGLNLIPGVYKWTTNVVIPTNLTLSGGANDTWIFQIDGTLDLAAATQIILAGGAVKQNVVWQVAGAVTIGPNASFKGTILAQTNVAVQTNAEVLGKLLAQTAVTMDQNLING